MNFISKSPAPIKLYEVKTIVYTENNDGYIVIFINEIDYGLVVL